MVQKYCCFIAAGFILAGCGLTGMQVQAVHCFGSATETLGSLGEAEFIRIRKDILEMNRDLIAIDNTKTSTNLNLDYPVTLEATARRVSACKAMRGYGELLVRLSGESRGEELAAAAEELMQNTCAALNLEFSEEQLGSVSALVMGLGNFWVEHKKAAAIRRIIPAYNETVDVLADLIQEDFSLDTTSLGFLKAYQATARRLKNAAIHLVNAGSSYSVHERDRAVGAYVTAECALATAEEVGRRAANAIKSMKIANAELLLAMGKKSFGMEEIRAYAGQIREFVNLIEVLAY